MFCFVISGFSGGFEALVLSNWCHCKSKAAAAAHAGLPLKCLGSTRLFCWGLMLLCDLFSNESKWSLLTRFRHLPKSFWRFYVCDSIKCCVNTITCVLGNCFVVEVLTQTSPFCRADLRASVTLGTWPLPPEPMKALGRSEALMGPHPAYIH